MSVRDYLSAFIAPLKLRLTRTILAYRIRARHPTLRADATAIWDYGYGHLDAIEIGRDVTVAPFAEIVVHHHSPHSEVDGRLIFGDRCVISTGVNIRAAGGTIRVGSGTAISQHCVLVAANHVVRPGEARIHVRWDEDRCGIDIGDNVWVAAGCIILPGSVIGDDAVIAAGSVVRGTVPAGELWGGVPAVKIRSIDGAGEREGGV